MKRIAITEIIFDEDSPCIYLNVTEDQLKVLMEIAEQNDLDVVVFKNSKE
jgi:hypothetical protein